MRFAPRVTELSSAIGVPELLTRLRGRRALVALDSPRSEAGGRRPRWSLVAFDPLRGVAPPVDLGGLAAVLDRLRAEPGADLPGPFHGGFIGALSYDLGVQGERPLDVATDPWSSPRIVGGLYVDFVVRDEDHGRCWLVLGDDPGDGRDPVATRKQAVLDLLARSPPHEGELAPAGPLLRATPSAEHRRRIERVRECIAAGDFYQANLAHRFTRAVAGDPVDLYLRLRQVNPAPHMGFLAWERETASGGERFPEGAILSASPELLLEFDPDRAGRGPVARTRPIKGTAPRGATPRQDALNARALMASEKDRAELAMIVDLERNDLGRVAVPGGVRVEGFADLETYASVHHLAADVIARVRPGVGAIDALAALFPGGSITGAPKLAAMEAIARLEGEGRGFFTGSLGSVDLRGHARFNILIRTLVWRPEATGRRDRGEVSFHVGGGITWSSNAEAEDQETLAKGAALAAALEPEPRTACRKQFDYASLAGLVTGSPMPDKVASPHRTTR